MQVRLGVCGSDAEASVGPPDGLGKGVCMCPKHGCGAKGCVALL